MQAIRFVPRLSNCVPRYPFRMIATSSSSNISGGAMGKAWADKEHAAEAQYFNKKDAEVLAKLAEKLKSHTAPTVESMKVERATVIGILEKYSVAPTDALVDDLIKFKFNDH